MKYFDDRKKFKLQMEQNSFKLGKSKINLKKSIEVLTLLDKDYYNYIWSWLGVPIIQQPSEILVNKDLFAIVYSSDKIEKYINEDIIPSWL